MGSREIAWPSIALKSSPHEETEAVDRDDAPMTDSPTQGRGRLLGKSAVITGAAFGIGRATAVLFAREGAHLVVTDIQGEPLLALADELRNTGAQVEAVVGDVADQTDAQRMITAALDRFGRLDVLVANAGIIPLGDAREVSVADWDNVMAIDGRGMFLTCKFAIEAMLPTGGGAIVCLSSISGLAGQKRQAAYGPAKFIATGLTKHLAVEWADRGIRVNAVAPGTIRTERVQQLPEEPGGSEYLAAVESMHPMGRIGEPSEVAHAIVFLASDEASFITGAVLPVDGGYLAQ
ncbi:SDR family NAD(P)-dependent oxidoreductase [Mycolicibacter nonchromogenicus]|nr:SDR family NAD(P)-dependent oxidoreductase [Mycolicibacter nonchromogenicus]